MDHTDDKAKFAAMVEKMSTPRPPHWTEQLDSRTRTHVQYAQHYAAKFAHGAPGHLDLMTIAELAALLDRATQSDSDDETKKALS
jgi:hypothetical protein